MRYLLLLAGVLLVTLLAGTPTAAQNVTGYSMMPDPLLFLLREPAVHDDLQLSREQQNRLFEINHSFDGLLLSTRNIPPEKSQAKIAEVMTATRDQMARLLSLQQQDRLRQIAYRLRGISCVLVPQAAAQLRLTSRQRDDIEAIVKETHETLKELHSATYQGKEAHQKSQQAAVAARRGEQQRILALLDDQQRQRLTALLGRPFDTTRLGNVSFKAPELSKNDKWINSQPLQLTDLRGKVIALHFWAFG